MKFKGKSTSLPEVPGNILGIYQEGGEIMEDPQAPQDPMVEMMMMAEQAVAGQDCQMAMQVCAILLEAAAGAQAEAPMEAAPAEEAPMP